MLEKISEEMYAIMLFVILIFTIPIFIMPIVINLLLTLLGV